MSEQEIRVPDLGGADEVEVIEISVGAGDPVQEEDPILTVESDKASVELPAPGAGTIVRVTVSVGDKVREGDVVAVMDSAGAAAESAPAPEPEQAQPEAKPAPAPAAPASSGGSRKETVLVPALDGFDNVPVIEINVSEGDTIGLDDPLVTVESDKATMEIPSPYQGKVERILVSEGDKLSEGDQLLEMTVVDEGGEAPAQAAPEPQSRPEPAAAKAPAPAPAAAPGDSGNTLPAPGTRVHAGPAVRKLARELGADLTRVPGSGPKGRIVKDDVQAYVKRQLQQVQQGGVVAAGSGIPGVKLPDFSQFGDIETQPMSRIMSATAINMQRSWLNVPHVTQFEDADITDMEAFRKSQKAAGEKRGVKMTPLPFLLKACATVLAELPQFNVSLDMDRKEVIRKKYIHIGIAVDTPHGLMVPVIRNVDQKGLWELAAESAELAQKARDKQLKPAEMQGACFTITSLGGIGGTAFTPIVNTPEVAILGVSKAAMKPVWDGQAFQPRLMLPLSLSYDHRAVNGADAARFTTLLSQLLGDIRTLLL